jgi:hypothetical protein
MTVIFQRLMRENDSSWNDGGGKNSVIYMGPISGPNTADDTCGKTTVTGTMDRGFTVLLGRTYGLVVQWRKVYTNSQTSWNK